MRHTEPLETRRLLASFTASSVAELISDINTANASPGQNTITLAAGTTFKLDAVDNEAHGPTGLPVIAADDNLTIEGNGDTIERGTGAGTPAFRLFDVAAGASLTLNNLTLGRGLASNWAAGGGIFSLGTLNLSGVTVQNCTAQGPFNGSGAVGGGIYSGGALTVVDSAIRNNQALGHDGDNDALFGFPVPGGSAAGGGIYIAGGTATLANTTLSSNLARGGDGAGGVKLFFFGSPFWIPGSPGGTGLGGGIYAAAGTLGLRGTVISHNTARGGSGGSTGHGVAKAADGAGQGGGLYIASGASASLDASTQADARGNTASTSDDDIFGSFTIV